MFKNALQFLPSKWYLGAARRYCPDKTWDEMQKAKENQFFDKQDKEYLEYIHRELKKGKAMELILVELRKIIEARKKAISEGRTPDDIQSNDSK